MSANRAFHRIAGASLLLASVSLAGCASTPKELPPQPVSASTSTQPAQPLPPPQPTGPVPGSEADFLASVISDTVHFELDKYAIDGESEGILRSLMATASDAEKTRLAARRRDGGPHAAKDTR